MTGMVILGGIVALIGFALLKASTYPWRTQGHLTRVPVDDFVVGDLPMICARTGLPADGLVEVESHEGSFQTWWLLLLLTGPAGIIVIAVLWIFARRPGRVGGSVPMTHAALAEQNRSVAAANWAWAVPAAMVGAAVLLYVTTPLRHLPALPISSETVATTLLVTGLVGGILAMVILASVANHRRVEVRLDGTARWVEIRNVHANFARAANQQVRARHRAARQHDTDAL